MGLVMKGVVIEGPYGNGLYKVQLENGRNIESIISVNLRLQRVYVQVGDVVRVGLQEFGDIEGRIIERIMETDKRIDKIDTEFGVNDILSFVLLESKYSSALENYDEERNMCFIKKCVQSNNDALTLMQQIQELLIMSIKVNEDKDYEKLSELKKNFDIHLEKMKRLSEILEITITPPNNNEKGKEGE